MKPEDFNPEEEMEVRITALLLGELSAEDETEVREALAKDPELMRLHDRLKTVMGLVKDAVPTTEPAEQSLPEPLTLNHERRTELLELFKGNTVPPKAKKVIPVSFWKEYRKDLLKLAAMVMALLGMSWMMVAKREDQFMFSLGQISTAKHKLGYTTDEFYLMESSPTPPPAAAVTFSKSSAGGAGASVTSTNYLALSDVRQSVAVNGSVYYGEVDRQQESQISASKTSPAPAERTMRRSGLVENELRFKREAESTVAMPAPLVAGGDIASKQNFARDYRIALPTSAGERNDALGDAYAYATDGTRSNGRFGGADKSGQNAQQAGGRDGGYLGGRDVGGVTHWYDQLQAGTAGASGSGVPAQKGKDIAASDNTPVADNTTWGFRTPTKSADPMGLTDSEAATRGRERGSAEGEKLSRLALVDADQEKGQKDTAAGRMDLYRNSVQDSRETRGVIAGVPFSANQPVAASDSMLRSASDGAETGRAMGTNGAFISSYDASTLGTGQGQRLKELADAQKPQGSTEGEGGVLNRGMAMKSGDVELHILPMEAKSRQIITSYAADAVSVPTRPQGAPADYFAMDGASSAVKADNNTFPAIQLEGTIQNFGTIPLPATPSSGSGRKANLSQITQNMDVDFDVAFTDGHKGDSIASQKRMLGLDVNAIAPGKPGDSSRPTVLSTDLKPADLASKEPLGVPIAPLTLERNDGEAEVARVKSQMGRENLEAKLPKLSIMSDTPAPASNALEKKLAKIEMPEELAAVDRLSAVVTASGPKAAAAKAEKSVEQLGKLSEESLDEVKELDARKKSAPVPPGIPQPEVSTAQNSFSTFSLNVSDVSFKLAAASLEQGVMPEPGTVRTEEFINAFNYHDPEPTGNSRVAFAWERARYPFAHDRDLVRFSVQTAAVGREPGKPLNIVLLLDNSGSMERADRIRIRQECLRVLAGQLQPQDKVSVVSFARTARLWVDGLSGAQAGELAGRVGSLAPEGGTNLEEAMNLAYQTAKKHYLPRGVNRVVLLTDGAANLGEVQPETLKKKVVSHRQQGVALDCFGIGWDGYNDDLLETLSRNGDGRYGFVNSPEAATTEFAAQLAGALKVAAADVKVQVEWNPKRVTVFRQLGYAKHQLKKEEFRDNKVDAAEIGAAEAGNALYTVQVNAAGEGPLGVVRVRYRVPGTNDYREQEWPLAYDGAAKPLEQAGSPLRLAATASAFSEWLVSSPYAAEVTPDRLVAQMVGVPETYPADPRPKQLEWMIRQARSLSGK